MYKNVWLWLAKAKIGSKVKHKGPIIMQICWNHSCIAQFCTATRSLVAGSKKLRWNWHQFWSVS